MAAAQTSEPDKTREKTTDQITNIAIGSVQKKILGDKPGFNARLSLSLMYNFLALWSYIRRAHGIADKRF